MKTIKRILIGLLAVAMCLLIMYSIVAFISWEANPVNWDGGMRAIVSIFGITLGLTVGGIIASNDFSK